jgi:biotin-(acetyl-CoA carboxylase) ligase
MAQAIRPEYSKAWASVSRTVSILTSVSILVHTGVKYFDNDGGLLIALQRTGARQADSKLPAADQLDVHGHRSKTTCLSTE